MKEIKCLSNFVIFVGFGHGICLEVIGGPGPQRRISFILIYVIALSFFLYQNGIILYTTNFTFDTSWSFYMKGVSSNLETNALCRKTAKIDI